MTLGADELGARLAAATAAALRPPERVPIDVWAERERRIATDGSGSAARTPLDLDRTPHWREVLRATGDPAVREIVVPKSTQTGFTEAVLHTVALHAVAADPRTVMFLLPDQKTARDFNASKLTPAVHGCAAAARRVASGDKRKNATSDRWRFTGCHLLIKYAGGGAELRMETVHTALCDEVDAYPVDSGVDPLESVRSRQEAVPDALTLIGSSPKRGGRVLDLYARADVRHAYHTPCPWCGQYFELFDFALVRWFGGLDAPPERAAADTHVLCPNPKCEAKIREPAQGWMMLQGVWVTQGEHVESDGRVAETYDHQLCAPAHGAPLCSRYPADFFRAPEQAARPHDRDAALDPAEAERVRSTLGVTVAGLRAAGRSHGFRSNRLQSRLTREPWSGLVTDFVKAGGALPATWWGERLTTFPARALREAKHEQVRTLCVAGRGTGVVPAWAAAVVTGVDIQKDCVKAMTWAYAPRLARVAVVETAVVPRHENGALLEGHLLAYLAGLRPRIEGTDRAAVPLFAIDSGHYTLDAYGLVDRLRERLAPDVPHRDHAGVWPVKGWTKHGFDKAYWLGSRREARMPGSGARIEGVDINDLLHVNTGMLKDELVARLNPETPGGAALSPVELPDAATWFDGFDPGSPPVSVADDVVAELVNEHRVRAGVGSGLAGKLGRGAERDEWVKIREGKPNDFLDTSVYARALAGLYRVDELAPDGSPGPAAADAEG